MEKEMTNRQIVDAIHEGLPTAPFTEEELAAPNKRIAGNRFAKYIDRMTALEKHANFPINSERKKRLNTIVRKATSIRQLINNLRLCLNQPFHDMVIEFINGDIMMNSPAYTAFTKEHWERLKVVVPHYVEDIQTKHPDIPEKWHNIALVQIALGGIANVTHGDLAGLLCIPQLYQETKGEILEPETWDSIGDSSLSLLLDITSSEQHVFDYGISVAMKQKNARPTPPRNGVTNFDFPAYDTQSLRITENNELRLHPCIIKPTRKHLIELMEQGRIHITGDRGGCPGRPLFPMIHKRIMSVAPEVIFANPEKILSLPLE